MPRPSQMPKPKATTIDHEPVILTFVTVCLSVVLIWKAPDSWAILVPELSSALHYFATNTHFQTAAALRYQIELLQNLATQVVARGQGVSLEVGHRQIPFEIRIKSAVMIAACDISVIVPALNEEKYLPRCLDSLVRESRKRP